MLRQQERKSACTVSQVPLLYQGKAQENGSL